MHGRTPTSFNHPGTTELRALAAGMKAHYHNAERTAIDELTQELMQTLKRKRCRFVEKVGGVYKEVLDKARNKKKCASVLLRYAELLPKLPAQNAPELAQCISAPMVAVPTVSKELLEQRGTMPEVHTEQDETTEARF